MEIRGGSYVDAFGSHAISLACEQHLPENAAPWKKTLVLVHGWPLCKEQFVYQIPELTGAGIRCITYDWRGFGNSDKPQDASYDFDAMVEDLAAVVMTLSGGQKVNVLGFSMGGAIASRFAAKYPLAIDKLILAGAAVPKFSRDAAHPYGMNKEKIQELLDGFEDDWPATNGMFRDILFATNQSEETKQWAWGLSMKADRIATIKCLQTLDAEDLTEDLKKIEAQTLQLHGRKDVICRFELAEETNQHLKHAKLVPLELSGHGLFIDEKDKFNDEVIRFLEAES